MFDPNADPNYNPRNLTKPKTGAWQIYKRLLHYAWGYKRRLTLSLFFSLVVAGSFTSMILGVAAVVNVLYGDQTQLEERAAHTAAQFEKRIPDALRGMLPWSREELADGLKSVAQAMRADRGRTLRWLAAVFVTLGLFAGIARFFQEYFAGSIGVGVSTQLGDHMFGNVMKLSLRFFEQHPTGELLARFTNDIFMVNRGLTAVLVKLMQEPLKALFFLCVALSRDPVLTVVGLCVLPPIGYVMIRIGQHFKRNVRRSLERIASMAGVINEVFSGILIVKGFAMESYELKRVRNELYKLRRYLLRMVRADAAVGPLVEFVIIVGLVAFILYAGKRFESGGLMAGDLVAVVSALALMLDPVRKLSAVNNMIQTSVASAERVFEFIDLEPEVPEMRNAVPIKRLREALRLDNVSFSYDGKTEVLKDITCEIKKGEMVALVGFSGAGKTTLIKLIPRFYDPTHGS
ncbi:MAG: ABC transporter ATP-binding protein, partial [Candidatus Hydrogenedentes bacterium]|nr:ABC transporter ATP-binding protein [Candidatus Hydrogenedentota bacterium]